MSPATSEVRRLLERPSDPRTAIPTDAGDAAASDSDSDSDFSDVLSFFGPKNIDALARSVPGPSKNVKVPRGVLLPDPGPRAPCTFSKAPPEALAAIDRGDTQSLAQLVEQGLDPRSYDDRGQEILQRAAGVERRAVETLTLLVNAGADPNCSDWLGCTPLHGAAWKRIGDGDSDSVAVTRALLERGADPNRFSRQGATPVHTAMVFGNERREALLRLYIDYGFDLNRAVPSCFPPITYYVGGGPRSTCSTSLLGICLAHGGSPDVVASNGLPLLHHLVMRREPQALSHAQMLLQHGASVTQLARDSELDPTSVAAFRSRVIDGPSSSYTGAEALSMAAANNNKEAVRLLMTRPAIDKHMCRRAGWAAWRNRHFLLAVRLLLKSADFFRRWEGQDC